MKLWTSLETLRASDLNANFVETATDADLAAHTGRTDNPHGMTPAQLGVYTQEQADAADLVTLAAAQAYADAADALLSQTGSSTYTAAGTGAVARTVQDKLREAVSVKDFGATLDGTTADTAAINNARGAVTKGGTVFVPQGGWVNGATPTAGPAAGDVLWRLNGNTFGTGTTPVTSIGTDTVETSLGTSAGKFLGRGGTTADNGPVLRIDNVVSHTGGTAGYVMPSLWVNTNIPVGASGLNNYVWGTLSQMKVSSTGTGQHVAVAGDVRRQAASGLPGSPIWGGYFFCGDNTGQPSDVSGQLVGCEIDVSANDLDPLNRRVGVDVVGFKNSANAIAPEWGVGVRVTPFNGDSTVGTWKTAFMAAGAISNAAFDSSLATIGASGYALKMASNQKIAFKPDGTRFLYYNSGGALQYRVNNVTKLEVFDSGNTNVWTPFQVGSTGGNLLVTPGSSNVTLAATGTAADYGIAYTRAGTGVHAFDAMVTAPSATLTGTLTAPTVASAGATLTLATVNSTGAVIKNVASAVNYAAFTPAIAGGDPIIAVDGADTSRNLILRAKGTGNVTIGATTQIASDSTNRVRVTGAASLSAPLLEAVGGDSDITMRVAGKGTNGVQFNAFSKSVAPTTTDIPAGNTAVWKNTGDGTVKLYYNDGGTLKSVALA